MKHHFWALLQNAGPFLWGMAFGQVYTTLLFRRTHNDMNALVGRTLDMNKELLFDLMKANAGQPDIKQ